jgi:hypothetical protein
MPSIGVHRITIGDTLAPLNTVLSTGDGDPYDLASYTVAFKMELESGTSELAETSTGVTAHPTQTFTAASTGLATCNGHGVKEGDQIIVATSGTLPSGLAASTRYFAVQVNPNTFGLAATPGGISVIAGAGTGSHTFYVVGSLQYDFAAGDVDAAGYFRAWVILTASAETHTFPADGHIPIEIQAVGN